MAHRDRFIGIPFTIETLDIYSIRKAILHSLTINFGHFKENLLDVGCGKMPYRNYILKNTHVNEYIGLDLENALEYDQEVKPNVTWNGRKIPFPDNSFSTVMATEVLEHCPDPLLILNEIFRVLKPEGVFFLTVPFLWNLHEIPHDEYRYTPFALERLLKEAGFKDINLKATGGWHASMAQMLGLWVRRSPIPENKRKIISKILKPVIKKLIEMDQPHLVKFEDGQMITGLYGTAKK